jgi:hypothetical protein
MENRMTNAPSIGKDHSSTYYVGDAVAPYRTTEFHKVLDFVSRSQYSNYIVNADELSNKEIDLLTHTISAKSLNVDSAFDRVNEAQAKADFVNHPSHYGGADNVYEVIKVMEAWLTTEEFIGAMKFNIHKYNARAKLKGTELENYEKAGFYQTYLVDFCRRKGLDRHV